MKEIFNVHNAVELVAERAKVSKKAVYKVLNRMLRDEQIESFAVRNRVFGNPEKFILYSDVELLEEEVIKFINSDDYVEKSSTSKKEIILQNTETNEELKFTSQREAVIWLNKNPRSGLRDGQIVNKKYKVIKKL